MSRVQNADLDRLLAALAPLVQHVSAPIHFHRAWVFRKQVLVLDLLVHGAPVGFDVSPEEHGGWRVEVIARQPIDGPLVRALGLPKAGRRRFHVATVPAADPAAVADEVAERCHAVLDRLAAAGPPASSQRLLETLAVAERVVVVDVGANPLDLPAYTRLLGLGAARVVGFEPQPEAFAALQGRDPERELYFPYAIGTPGPAGLHLYHATGFASTFAVDPASIELIGSDRWRRMTRLREVIDLELTALDDVPDLPAFDLLKIDVQGGELAVFRSGRRALASALCVIPEVSFFPLYRDAPTFADVHQELVAQGFQLHKFMFQKSVHLHGSQSEVERVGTARDQLVDGDAVYLRDLRRLQDPEVFTVEQVKKLVLLATFVFDSPDVAVRALDELVRRGAAGADLPASYAAETYV